MVTIMNTDNKSGLATILFIDEWNEIRRRQGKQKEAPYIIPESGVISIRFPLEYAGQPALIYAKKAARGGN